MIIFLFIRIQKIPLSIKKRNTGFSGVDDGNGTYDPLGRLLTTTPINTGSINQNTETYTYDTTGNRTTDIKNTVSTQYTTNTLDQYTTISGSINTILTYDNNGNIKSDGTRNFIYDSNNRLIQVTQSGTIIGEYQYDILGRRIQKKTPTETIEYIYAGDNIIQEIKTTGGLVRKKEYINGIGTDSLIAYDTEEPTNQDKITFCQTRVLPYQTEFTNYGYSSIISDCTATISSSTGVTTKRYYYHTNHLGSVIALTNGSGDVVQSYTYDSFGKPYIVIGSEIISLDSYTGNLSSNTRLYTGREYDREIKLYFLRARYYDASTGRFISRDPIGQRDQINLYTYVGNSPLNYIDPTGEFLETVWDVGNIAYDVGRGVKNIGELSWDGMVYAYGSITDDTCLKKQAVVSAKENFSDLGEVAIDAGTDAAAAIIPFVPAGTTKVVRMGKKIEKIGIDPSVVHFTQDTISKTFKRGGKVEDLTKGLKNGTIDPNSIPPIRIFEKDGKIFSLDNRRLKAFKDAGKDIPFVNASAEEVAQEFWKFTTINGGTSITFK